MSNSASSKDQDVLKISSRGVYGKNPKVEKMKAKSTRSLKYVLTPNNPSELWLEVQ